MNEKSYKFRFYPTKEQEKILLQTFGCVRVVYNHFLNVRKESYEKDKISISYQATSSLLTKLKKTEEKKWLNDVSCVPLQQTLRHLQTAYISFFKQQNGYPKFKKKSDTQSAEYTKSSFTFKNEKLTLAKIKLPLKIKMSRRIKGEVSSVTISKNSLNRYFVSFCVKEDIKPKEKLKSKIGIDLGLASFATISNGEKVENPKHLKKYEKKLAKEQRRFAKKQIGSKNRAKAKLKVARVYSKIKNTRNDFLHKLSTKLINENQVICVEDLVVKNMVRNRNLSKSILDVSWSEFVRQLEYKSKWYGRDFVKVGRFFPSSKTCSNCKHVLKELPLGVREWRCSGCDSVHDRDVNAAKNILEEGTSLLACGENISLVSKNISKSR